MVPLIYSPVQEVPSTPRASQVSPMAQELLATPNSQINASSPMQTVPQWSNQSSPVNIEPVATPNYDGEKQNLASFESLQVDAGLFPGETENDTPPDRPIVTTKVKTKRYLIPKNCHQGSVIVSNESGLFDCDPGVKIRSGGKVNKNVKGVNNRGYGANRRRLL